MNNDALVKRIHDGDQETFKTIYAAYGRDVYLRARKELGSDTAAKNVVKQTFLNLQREIMRADAPIDLAARINELAERELQLLRILAGESAEAVFEETAQKTAEAGAQSEETEAQAEAELPPLIRARSYMAAEEAGKSKRKKRIKNESEPEKRSAGAVVLSSLLLAVFLLLLIWVGVGILMDLSVLPAFDLGYSWFNAHVFPLFAA